MPPWLIPSHLYHNHWFLAFLIFFKRCQSCVQHTWISKHNRGGRSVLFGGVGGEGTKGENNHTTQPWTMSRSICGNSGGVGWLPGEGGSGTPSHAPHVAWHACPAPTAVIWLTHCFTLRVYNSPKPRQTFEQHPAEEGARCIISTV